MRGRRIKLICLLLIDYRYLINRSLLLLLALIFFFQFLSYHDLKVLRHRILTPAILHLIYPSICWEWLNRAFLPYIFMLIFSPIFYKLWSDHSLVLMKLWQSSCSHFIKLNIIILDLSNLIKIFKIFLLVLNLFLGLTHTSENLLIWQERNSHSSIFIIKTIF